MGTLKELLDELNVNTDDLEDEDKDENKDEISPENIDLDSFSDEQKPVIKKLLDEREVFLNEVAKNQLIIKTLKDAFPNSNKKIENKPEKAKDENEGEDEEFFGLKLDDPYARVMKKMYNDITRTNDHSQVIEAEKQFVQNVKAFSQENPDMVRYVKDMDELRSQLSPKSSLRYDIKKLYNLAKNQDERRIDNKKNKQEIKNKNFRLERSGISGTNVDNVKNFEDLESAFDGAVDKISSTGKQ